jgi:hypothetical protein
LSCLWAACCGCLCLPDPLGFSPTNLSAWLWYLLVAKLIVNRY